MGGSGSGWQWARRRTVREMRSIDVLWYHRMGMLAGFPRPYLEPWKRPSDGMTFEILGTSMVAYQNGQALVTPLNTLAMIERTPCAFGGTRPWFRCPGCPRRSRFLYETKSLYLCRVCCNLTYSSSQRTRDLISEGQRAKEQYRKLQARVGRVRSTRRREQLWRRMNRALAIQERSNEHFCEMVRRLTSKRP